SPDQHFEWTVLPQGMKNSPTLCQLYVDTALQPLRRKWKDTIIYHYMDDILLCQPQEFSDMQVQEIQFHLKKFCLEVSPDKLQRMAPWKYLGLKLTDQVVTPQKLQINLHLETLHDVQRLLGDLQWLRPVVGIPNELLDCLRPLLKGTDPATPIKLSSEQKQLLTQISELIPKGQLVRRDLEEPINLTVWYGPRYLLGALTQTKRQSQKEKIGVLEWVTPSIQQTKTLVHKIEVLADLIKRGRERPLEWYLKNSTELQEALLAAGCVITTQHTTPSPLKWMREWNWIPCPKGGRMPLSEALTAYTDAGRKSHKAAVTWHDKRVWQHKLIPGTSEDSLQTLELIAVVWALQNLIEPLNVVTDSLYVAGIIERIEDAYVKEVQNKRLFQLLTQLQKTVKIRKNPYAIIHIRSHKWDTGLREGNNRANKLVAVSPHLPIAKTSLAREAYSMFHQNAQGLHREFGISMAEARAIVKACPVCSNHNGGIGLGVGVSPRGLGANERWQMDVTHVPRFGRLKYVHVTIDTYSKFIRATAQTGEKALHVERHLHSCFAVMGVPKEIKTDNSPAYVSHRIKQFLDGWNVKHSTGIPHSPTGQAIIERANGTLKRYLTKH
ncbi:PO113 protein, partial [Psilopogon haemacephalus]|nr:PO113 protein [Psilopogon haemacephalus]